MSDFEDYQTIAGYWCNKNYNRNDIKNSLRSKSLEPMIDIRDYNISELAKKTEIMRIHKIRKSLVGKIDISHKPEGRILKYYPDRSLGDGLVYSQSNGFISDDECPPWDTWFYFEKESNKNENVLYCWVPVSLIDLISKSIKYDHYNCLLWG